MLAGNRFHPAEQVPGVDSSDVDGRQRAGSDQHRGHAVSHRLRQAGAPEHFDVVVGVNVDQSRQHPFAVSINDLRTIGLIQRVWGDRGDMTIADPDIAYRRGRAGSVEPATVADDRVEAHRPTQPLGLPGVNDHPVLPGFGPPTSAGPEAAPTPARPGYPAATRHRPVVRQESE